MKRHFDPSEHPRGPKGTPQGGKFVAKGVTSASDEQLINEWTNNSTQYREADARGEADDMVKAIASQPEFNGLAYRGVVVDENTAKEIMSSETFELDGLSSFSKGSAKATAFNYADPEYSGEGGVGIVFRTRLKNARDIDVDGEVVARKTNFKILSVVPPESDGPYMVVMEMIGDGSDMWDTGE